MKKKVLIVTMLFCMLSSYWVFGQTDYATIITNVSTALKAGTSLSSINTTATTYMGTQNADGSWPDISYVTGANGDVPFNTHLTRLYQYALAYTMGGGTNYASATLYAKLSLALEYWNANIHDANNWYYDQIGYPQLLGQTLVLMRGGSQALSVADSTAAMNYLAARENPSVETGANRIDESLHWLYRGALTASASVVSTAVTQGGSTLNLVASGSEGINYDYAYLQHGAELMTQTYGQVLLSDVYNMLGYLSGTSYNFTTAQIQTAFMLLHYTYDGAARGKWKDFSLDGRAISRANDLSLNATMTAQAMKIDATNREALRSDSQRLANVQPANYNIATPYHIHYWTGDYTLHNRPSYQFTVRSRSTRTLNDESINGENLLGTFLAEGATDIRVSGGEYYNIFPVWDWNMVPGVTMRNFATTPANVSGVAGTQAYVGGVSDSTYGASANYMNFNNVAAKKAWFFFDNEVVCLGAGITSTSPETVSTCVNQCLLNGTVSVNSGGTISALASQTLNSFTGNLQWALHGSVGYFFPAGGNINISNQSQSGSWNNINTTGATSTVTTDVFKMWVDHGATPSNSTYAYIVVPNVTTTAQMTAYNQGNINIIKNDVSYQVVKHEGLNMLQAIIRATGGSNGYITDPTSGLQFSVDQPCALLIKNVNTTTVSISIADPLQATGIINVGIIFPGTTPVTVTKAIVMPAGNYKGSSVSFTTNINDASTTAPSFVATASGNWATASTWLSNTVPISGANVSIPAGLTVTLAAAATRDAGSTTTVSGTLILGAALTNNGTMTINGGTIQINQAGVSSAGSSKFVYDNDATLILNNTSALAVSDGTVFWGRTYVANEFTTTAPRNVIIAGTGSVGTYGAGVRTVANLLKVTSNTAITTSYAATTVAGSITVSGTFEVAGTTTINANLTVNGICQIDAGGSIVAGSAAFDKTGVLATGLVPVYGASSTLKYNTGVLTTVGPEWTAGTANPGYPANVEIANGTVTGAASLRSCLKNFTIDGAAAFNLNAANGLNVLGNFVNNGSFTSNAGTVTLNGTAAQTLTGATTFYNLAINNSSNVSLNNNVEVDNALTFTSGKIMLGSSSLYVLNASTINGSSSLKYVVTNGTGALKIGNIGSTNGNVVFPVSYSITSYTPLTMNNSGATDNFSVNVQSPISSVTVNTPNQVIPVLWDIAEDNPGGSSAIITLQWNASDAAAATGFSIGSNNVIGHYTSSAWQQQATTVSGSGPYTAQNTIAYTSFSPFAIGMDGAFNGTTILPLTLLTFDAFAETNNVALKWTSANEVNVQDYSVEKGTDGVNFSTVGSLAAKNTLQNSYAFIDAASKGIVYYRLKMIDKDGSFSYSKTIAVNGKQAAAGISLLPNPVRNNLYIGHASAAKNSFISIYSLAGTELAVYAVTEQSVQTTIDVSSLSAGIYLLKYESNGTVETKQFLKL